MSSRAVVPDCAALHPGLYEVFVVKGELIDQGMALPLACLVDRDALAMVLSSRWIAVASDAAAVKAGRRPPPEAARSGLDGGEAAAKLSVGTFRCARLAAWRDVLDWAVTLLCGQHRINLYPVGCGDPDPDLSCTGEGKAQKRRDPSTKAESEDPSPGSVTRLSWVTSAVIGAPASVKGLGASQHRLARGRFPDSATASPSACAPALRWRSCGCGP